GGRRMSFSVAILAAASVLLTAESAAANGIEIRQVDARAYPSIRVTIVTPTASRAAPTLTEGGAAAAALTAQNLGGHQSVALLLDRSQSMHGRTLADAIKAARAFVAAKPASDQISVFAFGSEASMLADFSSGGDEADRALQDLRVAPRYGTGL